MAKKSSCRAALHLHVVTAGIGLFETGFSRLNRDVNWMHAGSVGCVKGLRCGMAGPDPRVSSIATAGRLGPGCFPALTASQVPWTGQATSRCPWAVRGMVGSDAKQSSARCPVLRSVLRSRGQGRIDPSDHVGGFVATLLAV